MVLPLISVYAVLGLIYSAEAATLSGSFSLMSFNVAGLPELLSSGDPEVDTPLISPRLAPYNVINVEEDFNYHAALYANDTHLYRTPTSGGAGIGSGLNSLSDYPYIDLDRVKWDQCYISSADCLTPKGFTYMRVKASDGMYFDLYNLHADAGSEDADHAARAANIEQLTAYIALWSAGMPVVVMGDTNGRYTSTVDGVALRSFVATTGLVDAWVKNIRAGVAPAIGADALVCDFPFPDGTTQAEMVACEVVDKIFVRSGPATTLGTTQYRNEGPAFLNPDTGDPLSDHYPIVALTSWTLSSALRMSDPVGGSGGTAFNDLGSVLLTTAVPKITSITIRAGERVDAVSYSLTYPNGTTSTISHGGTGGTTQTLTLTGTQHITSVTACQDDHNGDTRVFYLKLTSSSGATLVGGVVGGDCLNTTVPTDKASTGSWGLVGFWGRSGDEADKLAAIWGSGY